MKKFLLSITLMLAAIVGVQAQRVSLDFTTNDSWGFPVGSSNKTAEAATFTSGDYSIELTGSSGNGYYFNSDGYLMLGKSGATLTLPAFDFNVSKIEVVGRTGASENTLENVYVGSTAVSTQCKGSAATNTFEIAAEYQAAGTVYTIKIESKHNAQFTQINIYSADEPVAPSVSVPVASVAAGVYTAAQSVTFESEYANAENPTISYYYTTDGNEPTKESTLLEGALEVTESCTVKVIAVMTVGEEEYTSKVASYEYIISEAAKFVAVTAIEQVVAGKVLLVANNLAAHGISGNYGYLPVHNVTAVEGGIENAVYYGTFELEVAEGGWYIKDNNGKYLYMTETRTNFNVSEEIPAESGVWTIAIAENGTATITNVAMSKYVQYSTKYSSYGAYAEAQDGGVVPTLYVPYVEPTPEPEVTANAISLAFTRTGTNGESVSVVAVNENGETLENVSVAVATTVDFRPTAGSITEAILCPNVNGNTGADIEMTFTLSNLPEGFSFNNIGLDIHALNGGNRYQENGDNKVRQWNVAVAANDAAFGSLTDIDIAAGIGESGVSVHKVWDIEGAAVESAENSIVIKVNVTSGTKNEGCFFGLSEIQLTTVEVVEPEAPFEVVAVTPSEAVAELSTITVEFSEEIAGEQDLMAMETIYVGSRTNACNFTVDGKVLTITLWTPITAPGEYALKVPASVGITRASNGEAVVIDGEITFTVEAPAAPFEVVAVTPSEAVTELSTITVEFSEEIAGEQDLMAMETIYVGSRTNACNFTVDGKVLTITLWTPITAPGEYALKVPASVGITRASNGEAVVIDGEITFTVEAPAAPFEVVAVTPSEAVTELSTITVEFSEEIAGEQDLMAMETIYVGSRTNACNFTVDGKVLTITLWTPITAPGEYALKVPASVGITRASNGEAVVIDGEITFTVEEAVVEPETFTVTAALFPTVEGDVTEIKGIRVEAGQGPALAELPTGWTLTNEAGDEFEMNIQWLYDYETILIMVNPAITEAGTYTLTIPAGSLKTEDGKECEAAEFSWTIKDPYMPYNNGTRTRTDRLIKGITLTGASGENSYALTADEQTQDYTDATAVAVFKVEAGEELTITFDKIGEWIHQFVFIDFDGDGFTASIAEGSEWAPAEDLVAYSFYNNDSSDDNYGWNSVGTSITGNDRSTPAVPAFKAPETIGTYRMRVKQDWCNIDPAGDADGKFEDFKTNGGQIIDVILEVVEATTGIENVEAETVKAIYDITGRKIEKITEGGIYIVNGNKVLVK